MVNFNSKIFVAGHKGLVGSAIVRQLKKKGYSNILTVDKKKLDLTQQTKVYKFLKRNKPSFIFLAAAKVGGILSNNRYKADFIYNNLSIQTNIIKDYILKHHKKERVIVLNQRKHEGKSAYIKNLFIKNKKVVETFTMEETKVDSIRNIFKEHQVVIIPSTNQAFVSKLLGSIGGIDSTSLVFGLYNWKKYDNLDIDNLMFLDVKFPDVYNFNNASEHSSSFLRLFEKKYNTNQAKYTYIAYNIMMHFCSEFSYFKFQKVIAGGKINAYAPLYHYVNYELVPLK